MKTGNVNPSCHNCPGRRKVGFMRWKFLLLACLCHVAVHAADAPRRTALTLRPGDVIATGDEWLALPDIRATTAGYVAHAICQIACLHP